MTFLEIALNCIQRGWRIFPCKAKNKIPAIRGYYEASTTDEKQVRAWWAKWPDANPGIACGESDLCVVDKDHGMPTRESAVAWVEEVNASGRLPRTFTVLTGRRFAPDDPSKPEWGIQLYYSGAVAGSGQYIEDGQKAGDIQSWGDLVMAPGSIHPKSGERYEVLIDAPVAPLQEWVKELQPERKKFDPATSVDADTVNEWRTWLLEYAAHYGLTVRDHDNRVVNGVWIGVACPWKHSSGEDGEPSSTAIGMLDGKLQFSCLHGTCAEVHDTAAFRDEMSRRNKTPFPKPEPGADPVVIFGKQRETFVAPADWRDMFHTKADVINCPPPTFLIDQFLAREAICAIAAPVAQRKSLIALNMAMALTTKNPLFGFLPVVNQPSRVLYLCPEMGLISLSNRITRIGLEGYLRESLFVRSMNLGNIQLDDIPDAALDGSVLIVDTAIRFMKGDENSAADTRGFSEILFRTQRRQGKDGAIVVLYHSPKATKGAFELTLENCMRGSGELGAAITDAHGTRLQMTEGKDEYSASSFISHIKSRDYRGLEDFEAVCDEATCKMTKVGDAGVKVVLSVKKAGFKADADGKDAAAHAYVKANVELTVATLVKGLAALGIDRKKTWVTDARLAARGCGAKHTE